VSTPAPDAPLFSVVIPTYGRPRWLSEAIDSVMAQTVDGFELIVVDDASPEPVEVAGHPRIRLVRRERNGGAASARNTGVEAARGRYVTFLDDDDVYTPERLALGQRGIELGPLSVCWLGPSMGATESPRAWEQLKRNEDRMLEGRVDDVILEGLPPHLGQVTMAREAFVSVPFEPRFRTAEDIEWWIRASLAFPVVTVPEVGYRKRKHDASRLNYQHQVRIDSNLAVLTEHAEYFAKRPKAAARRWRSQAIFAMRLGDRRAARSALRRSWRLDPSASTLAALLRTHGRSPRV
jgi:glycosyltransferase involved in cell wall biosynthesis